MMQRYFLHIIFEKIHKWIEASLHSSSVTQDWFRYVPLSLYISPVCQIACKHSYSWIDIHRWFAMAAILNQKWLPKYKNPPIWAKFDFQVDYDVGNWYIHGLGTILWSFRSYHILCIVRLGDICSALSYSNQYLNVLSSWWFIQHMPTFWKIRYKKVRINVGIGWIC